MNEGVWVTGMGAVSAAGIGCGPLAESVARDWSSLRCEPELAGLKVGRAPGLPNGRESRRLDRSGRLLFAAAGEAWQMAGLEDHHGTERFGLIEGSSMGPLADLLDAAKRTYGEGRTAVRPTALIRDMTGAGGAAFAQARGIAGPVLHVSAGSVSAAVAIGEAAFWIRSGRADVVVCGGAECPLHEDVVRHFLAARMLADPAAGDGECRPFDPGRCGTVLGEGAGVVVLESEAHARTRGAEPVGHLLGYGLASESYSMLVPDPDGRGVASAAKQALAGSRVGPGWIKAHGTATPANDISECRGLRRALGSALAKIPITALKPTVGHALGASGGLEAVVALMALGRGLIPASLGTRRADPDLPRCDIVMRARQSRAREALLISEAFGGRSAALLMASVG